jgi:hypothetical protein
MMNQSVTIDVTKAQEQLAAPASPLKLWQRRLTILFIVQVLLILGVFAYQENSRVQVDAQPLLAIKSADIDRMVIQDASNKVTLQKTGSHWQLPDLHQLPVDKQKLDEILQKLDGTKLTWPAMNDLKFPEPNSNGESNCFRAMPKKQIFGWGPHPASKKFIYGARVRIRFTLSS